MAKKQKDEIFTKIKMRQEERQRFEEDTKEKVKEVMHRKPTYKKIEENYQKSVEMPSLAERKKQLEEIRNFYKPIDKSQMIEHLKHYETIKQEKQQLIQKNRAESIKEQREHY